jgi:hypothetical protein
MLGNAQITILNISILLLILTVGIIIWFMKDKKQVVWPPISQPCPDFWKNAGNECASSLLNGNCETSINFSNVTLCDKYKWAHGGQVAGLPNCGSVLWDGVSYGYGQTPCED